MKRKVTFVTLVLAVLLALCTSVYAVDMCDGIQSLYNPFPCQSDIGEGNCVWWAAHMRPDLKALMNHSAKYWLDDARKYYYIIGTKPIVGSIVVFPSMGIPLTDGKISGHVAYVTKVLSNTKFEVTEMGYNWFVGERPNTYDISSTNTDALFIYPRDCVFLDSDTGVICHDYYEEDGEDWSWPEDAYHFVLFKSKTDYKELGVEGRSYFDAIAMHQYLNWKYVDLAEYFQIGDEVSSVGGGFCPAPDDDSSDPGTPDPTPDADVHIDKVTVSKAGADNFQHELIVYTGEKVDIEADIENKGDEDITVKIRYLWDDDKSFGFDSNNYLGRDEDVQIDHGKRDNGQYENVIKHFRDVSFNEPGTYYLYVEVSTDGDLDQSASHNTREYGKVIVKARPISPSFTASPQTGIRPLSVSFTDTSQGTIHTWNWNFGDGSTSNEPNPVHLYDKAGSFSVTLTVSDLVYTTSKQLTITVKEPNPPKITVTNPTPGEEWDSDEDHTIRWSSENLPYREPIKIEYSCDGGKTYRTIYDGYTTNDYSKKWKMDKSKTKDTSSAYLRFIRLSDNSVISVSHKFKIDHKKGTPSW